jgi:hypothetical protein
MPQEANKKNMKRIPSIALLCVLFSWTLVFSAGDEPTALLFDRTQIESRLEGSYGGKLDAAPASFKHLWAENMRKILLDWEGVEPLLEKGDRGKILSEAVDFGPELIALACYRSDPWLEEHWDSLRRERSGAVYAGLSGDEKRAAMEKLMVGMRFYDLYVGKEAEILFRYKRLEDKITAERKFELTSLLQERDALKERMETLLQEPGRFRWGVLFEEQKKRIGEKISVLKNQEEDLLANFRAYVDEWGKARDSALFGSQEWMRLNQEYAAESRRVEEARTEIEKRILGFKSELTQIEDMTRLDAKK